MRKLLLVFLLAGACGKNDPCKLNETAQDRAGPPTIHTPRWAFEPWISKDISDTDDSYAFVGGFQQRDIPIGVLVLDSPWETQYNTFVPNPTRYHDFQKLLGDMHAQNVRLVLWITQMVNNSSLDLEMGGDKYDGPSPNYDQGDTCKYYVNQGDTYLWWKGVGAALDFSNKSAVAWWHRQQDPLLDLGFDGWKLDFGDSYVNTDPVEGASGSIPHQDYSESYYRDYLAYATARRGPDFTTLVRGWDESYHFAGRFYARPENAPIVWAGDNRRDWIGLIDALDTTFKSARAGYVVLGSDIGGYLDLDDKTAAPVPFSQLTFVRWTAIGALSPFMELHGRANLTPWTVPVNPDETTMIYKYWATLHHELVPFFYSLAVEAYAGQAKLLEPVGDVGDYRYTLGGALLVAPILDDTGIRDVALPAGARWHDWWNEMAYDGGTTLSAYDSSDHSRIPLFAREGAILPMRSSVDVWPGADGHFLVHDEDGATTDITLSAGTLTFSRVVADTTLRVHVPSGATTRPLPASTSPVSLTVP
jgi:alpha-glucosidase (family GH31 glycosyl hydrolase)